jgi:[acyl-carrier-protein] S-malonyltransferase
LADNSPLFLPSQPNPAIAWLFPGQGAQEPGMGRDLYGGSAAARAVFDTADRVLGYSLTEVCFQGPEERLRDTRFAQPAILTTSLAALAAAVESGSVSERPAFTAGHSLGEYTALIAAGALSLEDGLRLIQQRADLMAQAAEANPGTLAAIIGLDEEAIGAICAEADVDLCNLNLPSQTVIGGSHAGVARAIELAKAKGAQRALELNVSGAFHSRLMQPAVAGLIEAVGSASVCDPEVPVVANANAQPLRDAASVREELGAQIARPVSWHESVAAMAATGVSTFIEFGPGRVLTGLVRRAVPGANLINVSNLAEATSVAGAATRA